MPNFGLHGFFLAHPERWALYSEVLGKEIRFYTVLVFEMWPAEFRDASRRQACGRYWNSRKNWSRHWVIDYMHANDFNDVLAQTEDDRYIAWPGQALVYKMGELIILELRDEAKKQLGEKFNMKGFHDEILNGGARPLDLLQERVEA